jgi:dihydrofolate reductase
MISIVAAMDEKRGIGKGNDLLFKIPEDFERMRALTTGHPIIMGRRTFESIGRVLPNRYNIVITRDPDFEFHGLSGDKGTIVNSLENAVNEAKKAPGSEEIIIFGGGQVFKEAIEKGLVDFLYLTIVKGDYGADTFFPEYPGFKIVKEEKREKDGFAYSFVDLEKI